MIVRAADLPEALPLPAAVLEISPRGALAEHCAGQFLSAFRRLRSERSQIIALRAASLAEKVRGSELLSLAGFSLRCGNDFCIHNPIHAVLRQNRRRWPQLAAGPGRSSVRKHAIPKVSQ